MEKSSKLLALYDLRAWAKINTTYPTTLVSSDTVDNQGKR
jgi:hypothetical protein